MFHNHIICNNIGKLGFDKPKSLGEMINLAINNNYPIIKSSRV